MPELPEVETIVRQLRKRVMGKTIRAIKVYDHKVVGRNLARIHPQKIINISRYGKYILLNLEQDQLLAHLRMTGYFQYVSANYPIDRNYLAAQIHFTDDSQLTFHEIRRFGELRRITNDQLNILLEKLGPDPVAASFTFPVFSSVLAAKKNATIKATLLDQRVIAGIGNIYAQEALYRAKIDPQRKVAELSTNELRALHRQLRSTLQLAIRHQGTTVQNYLNINGAGKFQKFLTVYEKDQCPEKHLVEKIVIGGRGTYWCKRCQR